MYIHTCTHKHIYIYIYIYIYRYITVNANRNPYHYMCITCCIASTLYNKCYKTIQPNQSNLNYTHTHIQDNTNKPKYTT